MPSSQYLPWCHVYPCAHATSLGGRVAGTTAIKVVAALSPAIKRAFHAAKDAKKASGATYGMAGDGMVAFGEFRLLLVFLKKCVSRSRHTHLRNLRDDEMAPLRSPRASVRLRCE